MRVMLTSCGLETEQIKKHFLGMLGKEPADTKALFMGHTVSHLWQWDFCSLYVLFANRFFR